MVQHETQLLATTAVGLAMAFVGGFLATRLRLPAIVGYLLAGVAVGPFTPGLSADPALASQLAEMGVILLMFGVGIHFSFADLLAVRRIAVPGAIVQIAGATLFGAALTFVWGWDIGAGLVFGLALSVASTVVLLRAIEERGALESMNAHIAVGWLVVEDLVMVLTLVLLPAIAGALGKQASEVTSPEGVLLSLALTLGKVALFLATMVIVGRRVIPWLLAQVAKTGSRELFTLSVLAVALGVAVGSAMLFGVSFALGAFFAGVVVSESSLSHRVAENSLPLRDAFSVLFFVSVGMLFDPNVLVRHPFRVLAVLAIVVLGKSLAAFAIVLLFRYPVTTALTVSASLAQIGEFSFILIALGVSLGLVPAEATSLIVAGALLSITLNPFVFRAIDPTLERLRHSARFANRVTEPVDPLAVLPSWMDRRLHGHAVLIGYGRVGSLIGKEFAAHGVPWVVVEQNREYVERLRDQAIPALYGDAVRPLILSHAHLESARLLVVATPDALQARQIIEFARSQNPTIEIIVRTHSEEEQMFLESLGVRRVVMGEHALARVMAQDAIRLFRAESRA